MKKEEILAAVNELTAAEIKEENLTVEQLSKIKASIDDLKKQIDDLTTQNIDLAKENSDLKAEGVELQKAAEELANKLSSSESEKAKKGGQVTATYKKEEYIIRSSINMGGKIYTPQMIAENAHLLQRLIEKKSSVVVKVN